VGCEKSERWDDNKIFTGTPVLVLTFDTGGKLYRM